MSNEPMAPVENENLREALLGFLRANWLLGLMAGMGGLIAVLKSDRRLNARQMLKTLGVSVLAGGGLTPLFAHVFGLPHTVAPSLACFIGVISDRAIDALWMHIKKRAKITDSENIQE